MPLLELRNVTVRYGRTTALSNLSLRIPRGEITAIIGPSGCGKTTLLKVMNRLIDEEPGAAVDGDLLLNGAAAGRDDAHALRERVGMVFQTPMPFPLSIRKNVAYALPSRGVADRAEQKRIVREKLAMVRLWDEVAHDPDRSALHLSGGQQQRLCIARALATEPEALLLDEPCSSLDVGNTANIEDILKSLKGRYTFVIVTHNLAQARRIADRVVVLMDGSLVEEGPAADVFAAPKDARTAAYLGGAIG